MFFISEIAMDIDRCEPCGFGPVEGKTYTTETGIAGIAEYLFPCMFCFLLGSIFGIILTLATLRERKVDLIRTNHKDKITADVGPNSVFEDIKNRFKAGTFSDTMMFRRGSLFALSTRKVSSLTGAKYGLIEARGIDLQIVSIDSAMRELLVSLQLAPALFFFLRTFLILQA